MRNAQLAARATGKAPPALWFDLAVIVGSAVLLTAIVEGLDLDRTIARQVVQIGSPLGNRAETASAWSFVLAAVSLVVLAIAPVRRRWPILARSAGVFVVTLLIAVLGLINNIKNEIDRPRPDQTVEYGGAEEYRNVLGFGPKCDCKSFPSTAAGFAFVVAAPYFVLRRHVPRLARSVLGVGLAWGWLVGYWRMVSGRHWVTDILWSAAIVLAVAAVLARLAVTWRSDEP